MNASLIDYDSTMSNLAQGQDQAIGQAKSQANQITTKVRGVIGDIAHPLLIKNFDLIGKSALQIGKNLNLLKSPAGGWVDTYLKDGVSGIAKKGYNSVGTAIDDFVTPPENWPPTAPTGNVQSALLDADEEVADNTITDTSIGSGITNPLARPPANTAGGDAKDDAEDDGEEAGEDDAVDDGLEVGSGILDSVPVAGLVLTGVVALGLEIGSWFEDSTPDVPKMPDVETGLSVGYNTL